MAETKRRRQERVREFRGLVWSPGRPSVGLRADRVRFWSAIAGGSLTPDAAQAAGVSPPVGFRWFRHAGGVNPCLAPELSGRYLSFGEREDIAVLRAKDLGVREIARRIGRSPSTVSRELRRGASTRTDTLEYKASTAQWHAERRARRPKDSKLATCSRLREWVQDRLNGFITDENGQVVGPVEAAFNGKAKPHRADRRWVHAWSPEQIASRLPVEFPEDPAMRISHEAIYQALYIDGRGGLERELSRCLRKGRNLRIPRARGKRRAWAHVSEDTLLDKRPAEADDRQTVGHWEGDLIIGLHRSAIGTVVERTTRFTKLVYLPREDGYGQQPRVKNGPPLAGYGAQSMKNALEAVFSTLPAHLWRSVTWDRGKELSAHADLTADTGVSIYFADPHSPWQRGTNENTNGLLRQYFPKGTDLSRWSATEIAAVERDLNNRPRKVLGWKTPAEALRQQIESHQATSVASTG